MEYVRIASHALDHSEATDRSPAEGSTLRKLHVPPSRPPTDLAYGETAEMAQAELTMALHGRARRTVTPESVSPACVLLCSQASRGGARVALNIFTAALLYAVSPELGAETATALQTQKAVLAGLLFLCSTATGRKLFEDEAALVLLHEAVFGLAFANDIEVQLLALQSLFKLGHLPAVANFLCDPTPLQGLISLLHEERVPSSAELLPLHRRLLSCCLQLLTLLLASDAAATHLDAFAQLPPLLERLEAITSDPNDPVRLMAGPVRERLEQHRRMASKDGRGDRDCVVS